MHIPFLIKCLITFTLAHCSGCTPQKGEKQAQQVAESTQAASELSGSWVGRADFGVMKASLAFNLSQELEGTLTGTFSWPEQGITLSPVEGNLEGDGVYLKVEKIGASLELRQDDEGELLTGQLSLNGSAFPIELTKGELPTPNLMNRPQEPKAPFSYAEVEATYPGGDEGVEIHGTLTLPHGKGPFPVALLLAGSGPFDRNEFFFGHKPFWVLADHLTRSGIAVLRVDKRGVGESTGDFSTATIDEFAADALAGVNYLKERSEIDPTKIGLIGHSEGGLVAPLAASQSTEVSFVVLMAAPAISGEELLYAQGANLSRHLGFDEEAVARQLGIQKEIFTLIKEESEPAKLEAGLNQLLANYVTTLPEKERAVAEGQIQSGLQGAVSPWFRRFLVCDPSHYLRQVKVPLLALSGEKDQQVDTELNLPKIEKALKEGGNSQFEVVRFPGLNHGFQTCETGALEEYAQIEETLSPQVLEKISRWIHRVTKEAAHD